MENNRKLENDCEKATFLVEKKLFDDISLSDDTELKLHLVQCPECVIYEQQSVLINGLCRQILNQKKPFALKMNEGDKLNMQALIKRALGKI